jgi:LmbE family N-acetylglucosaminyl deacetylase
MGMMNGEIMQLISARRPCGIPGLLLSGASRILMLVPHPDDFDSIGVTMKFLSNQGHAIAVVVARTGNGMEDRYCTGFTLAEKADLREREQKRSLQFFDLPDDALTFLRLANDPEDQPLDNPENVEAIVALLMEKAPDILFLPHGNDTNNGHRAMHSLLAKAVRRSGRPLVVLLNRDPKTLAMRTDLSMPFGRDEAESNAALLRLHDSQHQRNLHTRDHGFDERILDANRATSRDLNLADEYAEDFEMELYHVGGAGD